jgi:hypothetical protein
MTVPKREISQADVFQQQTSPLPNMDDPQPSKKRPALTLTIPERPAMSCGSEWNGHQGTLGDTTRCGVHQHQLEAKEEEVAIAWVERIANSGIGLVCLDFDMTLVSTHTGGKWWAGAKCLARCVFAMWRVIVPALIQKGIDVCVVTMSAQTKLVAEVLRVSMPCDTSHIRVRGGERGRLFTESGDEESVPSALIAQKGKQCHMNCVLKHRHECGGSNLLPSQVLLVDDDVLNVMEASDAGFCAIAFDPEDCMGLCEGNMQPCPSVLAD